MRAPMNQLQSCQSLFTPPHPCFPFLPHPSTPPLPMSLHLCTLLCNPPHDSCHPSRVPHRLPQRHLWPYRSRKPPPHGAHACGRGVDVPGNPTSPGAKGREGGGELLHPLDQLIDSAVREVHARELRQDLRDELGVLARQTRATTTRTIKGERPAGTCQKCRKSEGGVGVMRREGEVRRE